MFFFIKFFFFGDFFDQISDLILLTVAAVESSISLTLLIVYYKISDCSTQRQIQKIIYKYLIL